MELFIEIVKAVLLLVAVLHLGLALHFERAREMDRANNCLLWAIVLAILATA
jgi:uncharacterized membrane protein YhaH (DUF805 family)